MCQNTADERKKKKHYLKNKVLKAKEWEGWEEDPKLSLPLTDVCFYLKSKSVHIFSISPEEHVLYNTRIFLRKNLWSTIT